MVLLSFLTDEDAGCGFDDDDDDDMLRRWSSSEAWFRLVVAVLLLLPGILVVGNIADLVDEDASD